MIAEKEKAVLRLIAAGESDERIRVQLGLSRTAFVDCLEELFTKFQVSSRLELIFFACSQEGKVVLEETRTSSAAD
jgi:DNA-binding NarL/FixJ family response regulator